MVHDKGVRKTAWGNLTVAENLKFSAGFRIGQLTCLFHGTKPLLNDIFPFDLS